MARCANHPAFRQVIQQVHQALSGIALGSQQVRAGNAAFAGRTVSGGIAPGTPVWIVFLCMRGKHRSVACCELVSHIFKERFPNVEQAGRPVHWCWRRWKGCAKWAPRCKECIADRGDNPVPKELEHAREVALGRWDQHCGSDILRL